MPLHFEQLIVESRKSKQNMYTIEIVGLGVIMLIIGYCVLQCLTIQLISPLCPRPLWSCNCHP